MFWEVPPTEGHCRGDPGYMNPMSESSNDPSQDTPEHADPIDVEAAEIDVRAPEAPEEVAELIGHAQELGHDAHLPGDAESASADESNTGRTADGG